MLSKKGSNSGSWSDKQRNSEYAARALGDRLSKPAKSVASTTSTVDTTDFDSSFSSSRHQGSFGDSFSSRNEESSGSFSFQGGGPPDLYRCGPQRGYNRHNDEDLDGDCFLEQSSTNLFWSNDIIESSKKAIDSRGHAWRVKKAKRGMAIPPPHPMEDDDEDNGFAVVFTAFDSASGRNSKGVPHMTGSPQMVDERHLSTRSSGSLKDVQEEDYQEDVDDSLSQSFGKDSKSTENTSARPKSDQRSSKPVEDKMSDGVGDDFQTYTTNCQVQISDFQTVAKSRQQIKSKDMGQNAMPQPSKSGRKKNQEEEPSRTRRHRSSSRDSLVLSDNEDTSPRTIRKAKSGRKKDQEAEPSRTRRHRSTSRDSLGPSETDTPIPTSKCKSSRKKNQEEKARRARRRSASRDSLGSSESDSPGLQKNKEGVSRCVEASGDRKDSTSMPAPDIEEQALVQKLASAVLNGQVFDNVDNVGALENLVRGLEDALHIAKQALSMRDLKVEYVDTLHNDQGKPDLKRGMSLPAISTASARPVHGPVPIAPVEQESSNGEMPSKKGFRSLFRSLRSPRGVEEGGPEEASGRARRRSVDSDSRRRVANNQRD